MSDCLMLRDRLALRAGGDLDPAEAALVDRHLASCHACGATLTEFQFVISRDSFNTLSDMHLSDLVRRKVALESALRSRAGWWRALPVPGLRPGAMAVAAAVLFALVAVPVSLRNVGNGTPVHEITNIDIVSTPDGQVTLAWTDGSQESYTVYKSSDPRDFRDGEAHVVLGTVWTDASPAPEQVVFYRVE